MLVPSYSTCKTVILRSETSDTGTNAHLSMEELFQKVQLLHGRLPDAIAGHYNEIPALELSVMATTLRIPIVAHRAFDYNPLIPDKHPFFSQVSADSFGEMQFLATYLNHTGRTNYIAFVYCSSSASIMQKVDILRGILDLAAHDNDEDEFNQVRTFSYRSQQHHMTSSSELLHTSIRHALEKVKATGFRTIVWISDNVGQRDGWEIHQAASDLGLDQGQHLWVLMGGVAELSSPEQLKFLEQSNASYGPHNYPQWSAYLTPYEGFDLSLNKFPGLLFEQNHSFVERLEAITTIPNHSQDPTRLRVLQ